MHTYLIPDGEADCATDITEAESFVDAYTFVEGDQVGRSLIDIALADGYMAGDFYLQGGSLNVFTPGIGFDENGHVFDLNNDGINTFVQPIAADFISGTGKNVCYSIISPLFKIIRTSIYIGSNCLPSEVPTYPKIWMKMASTTMIDIWLLDRETSVLLWMVFLNLWVRRRKYLVLW